MILEIINESKVRIPRKFIQAWVSACEREFLKARVFSKKDCSKQLTLVFLDPVPAKKLNFEFRQKNYATDVLSFDAMDESSLGELIMCPQVLKKQSQEHGLLFKEELGYMILHGLLHLKGYDHELSEKDAEIMFGIQDRIFEKILRSASTASLK